MRSILGAGGNPLLMFAKGWSPSPVAVSTFHILWKVGKLKEGYVSYE
jgi:hypothetical protein